MSSVRHLSPRSVSLRPAPAGVKSVGGFDRFAAAAAIGLMAGCIAAPAELIPADRDEPRKASEGTGADDSSDSAGPWEQSDDDAGFLSEVDLGSRSTIECSLWSQDCEAGMKCVAYSSDGSGVWNATGCVEVVAEPKAAGEPCVVPDPYSRREDDCELGATCWEMRSDGEGICLANCLGSEADPTCAAPNHVCVTNKDGTFNLCMPECTPLDDQCPAGCGCYPVNGDFLCAPDASGDSGAVGTPCGAVNGCDPGNLCADASQTQGCDGGESWGCCTSFCDLAQGENPCELEGQQCVPAYERGTAPPRLEDLGICLVDGWDD